MQFDFLVIKDDFSERDEKKQTNMKFRKKNC